MAVRLPVDPSENLDQIITRLKKYNSQDVVLVLPPETRVLQELNNFYTLRSAVRAENINLSIAGGNKTIRGLANLLGFSIEKEGAVTSFKPDAPVSAAQPAANPATVFRPNYSGLPEGFVAATPPPQSGPIRPAQPQNFANPPVNDPGTGRHPLPRPGFNLGGGEVPDSTASTYDEVSRNGFFNNNNLGRVDATFEPAKKASSPLDEPIIDFDEEELPDTVAGQFKGRNQLPVRPNYSSREPYVEQDEYEIEEVADPDEPGEEVVAAKGRTRRVAAGSTIKTTTRVTVAKGQSQPQDMRQRLILIFGVLFALLLLVLLALLLIKPGGGGVLNLGPSVQTLTVPLRTEQQTATVRLALVPGTIGAAPTATTATGTVGTALPGTPGATATAAPVGPANLPVEMVNTGQIKKSGEHPATGSRKVPDKPASGPAIFYNRSFSAKSYGAGAVIYTRNGVTYRLVRAITIDGSQTLNGQAGQATGEVVADKAGTIGNIPEVVSFPLNENVGIGLGPLTNGSDKDEKFITQADQDDLKKQLRDQALAEVNNALKYDQTTQGVLVIKTSEPVCEFPKKINEIADSFAGSCTTSLEAARYNSNDVTRLATAHFVTDPAYRLDPNSSVEFVSPPKLVEDGGQRYMEVQVKGTVVSNLDTEAFKAAIAGKTKAVASTVIASDFPAVDLSLLDFKSLSGDSIPAANLLEIKTVLDYEAAAQATQTVMPGGTASPLPSPTIKS